MNISVIIPMFNSQDSIYNTIFSVINQDYINVIEIIIVNDGSTDDSEKIVTDIIRNNKASNRIIRLINKNNGGVSSARNRGIEEASFDWIAFLDSDDIYLPGKISNQVNIIKENSEIKFIGSNRNNEHYPYFNKYKERVFTLSAPEIIMKWYPHTSTVIMGKELFKLAGGYDESRSHAEDGDLLLRIAMLTKLYILNEDLVYTGNGKRSFGVSGLSANLPKMYQGEILALKSSRDRKQIGNFLYILFYLWLTLKYIRRRIITKVKK